MSNRLHLDARRVIAVILLVAAIGLPGYVVLSPHTSLSAVSTPR